MADTFGGRCSHQCSKRATRLVDDGNYCFVHWRCEGHAKEEGKHGWCVRYNSPGETATEGEES